MRLLLVLSLATCASLLAGLVSGCGEEASSGSGGTVPWTNSGASGGDGGSSDGGGGGGGGSCSALCPTVLSWKPDLSMHDPRVAGEWHDFALDQAVTMEGPDGDGVYHATVELPPGLHAYKLVYQVDQETVWAFDPGRTRRKYVGDIENSAVLVRDCCLPELAVEQSEVSRSGPGQGSYQAVLSYRDAIDLSGPDPSGFEAVLLRDQDSRELSGAELSVDADGTATIALADLDDGKYRVQVRARTASGQLGDPLRLVFWVEEEAFSWQDALIYMVMTDRFQDGDPSNNPSPTAGAEPEADWFGGDLQGLRQAISDGHLDELGVRAIWLTPFQTVPEPAYLAADGVHQVTGYHGYWPIQAREVDPRLGGADALHDLVSEAHAHGIRVLQDYVINHVHEDHEYVTTHPDWFRTGCVCGVECDWTEYALECMFAEYMPDIDHTVTEATSAFVDDAVWWLDEFDLDGLRIDAVKHVEEAATRNLTAAVRETFEPAGTRYFLMGETAMGWNECDDPCNDENYGTIARYIGPHGLDGQFDFVLYHAVTANTFAWGDKGMIHVDYWFQHGQTKWPDGAVMTPYIGSHDTPRFVSHADYRGQDPDHDRGIPGNKWDDIAEAPADAEPYRRMRTAMSWLMGLPGAPLLYYGDEYGQWGGADPNNRMMWRSPSELAGEELTTLELTRALGTARKDLPALRRGDYVSLSASEDTLVYARHLPSDTAVIVALTRSASGDEVDVDVSALGLSAGTELVDRLGGPSATVAAGGELSISLPPFGSAVLAP